MPQLIVLYDGCAEAAAAWLGAINKPCSSYGDEGVNQQACDVIEEEMERLHYLQGEIVAELRKRPMPARYQGERARVLVAWWEQNGEDDDELKAEAMRSLEASAKWSLS